MRFLDFFSGIGGFRLAFEKAGHECVGHCEIDKFADKSYRAMHDVKDSEYYASDIRTIKPSDLPRADIYTFGFPCQSFSIAGKRGGFDDTRGTLFFEVMRLAKVRKPKYLVAENVSGLLSHNGGGTFGTILASLEECGYDAEWQVLNSKYYVPQNRERVFIVGYFRGKCRREVFPIKKGYGETVELQRQTTTTIRAKTGGGDGQGTYIIENKQPKQVTQIGNIIDDTYRGFKNPQSGRIYDPQGPVIHQRARGYNQGGEYKIAPPLTSSSYQENNLLKNNRRLRRLTPKECFRLQGFPDELFEKAQAVNSDSQLYKQAGNSVTVPVVYEIAKKLSEIERHET